MIDRVDIQGFQSIAKVSVPLGKLTVLSGPSNSGKSAFVRALRALVVNPRGDWYMREDAPGTEVSVVLDDSAVRVTFGRVKAVYYTVAYPEADEDYTAVGTNVPDEVSALLNIDPDIQVTDQFDPPYLLNVPGSQVAKALGQITKSDRMLKATNVANAKARERKASVAVLTDQIIRDRETLERDWAWYAPAANAVRELVPLVEQLRAIRQRLEALSALRSRLAGLEAVAGREMPAEAFELLALAEPAAAAEARLMRLHALRTALRQSEVALGRFSDEIAHYEDELGAVQARERQAAADLQACPVCGTQFQHMPVPAAGRNRVLEHYH